MEYTVIKMQARCPKCRKNVKGMVKANKYKHGYPHVCEPCYKAVQYGGESCPSASFRASTPSSRTMPLV